MYFCGIHLVSLTKQYVFLQVQDFTDQFPGSSAALKLKVPDGRYAIKDQRVTGFRMALMQLEKVMNAFLRHTGCAASHNLPCGAVDNPHEFRTPLHRTTNGGQLQAPHSAGWLGHSAAL